MKAYLKKDIGQVGDVVLVYTTEAGQKRMEVKFAFSTVDADVQLFEVINAAN